MFEVSPLQAELNHFYQSSCQMFYIYICISISILSNRQHAEEIKKVIKPFDWTYTSDYRGSLCNTASVEVRPFSL